MGESKYTSKTHQIAAENTILRGVSGSELYGMSVGGGDRDEMGVCVEPPEYVIGLKRFEQYQYRSQPQGVRSGPGDLDLTIYSLRKWARLAADGNPTVLLLGYTPDDKIIHRDHHGELLQRSMPMFVSRRAAGKFIGYCDSQLKQLRGEVARKHTNRPELVEKYGYDTKFAAHAVRLGVQGIQFLTEGTISLPIPEPHRAHLIDIRNGKVDYTSVVVEIETLLQTLRRIEVTSTDLRPAPADREIDVLLQSIYVEHWETRGLIGHAVRESLSTSADLIR